MCLFSFFFPLIDLRFCCSFSTSDSLDSKRVFYSMDCLLNNLIKILLNNYTAVGCLMKCFQCGLSANSNNVKLLCALCIKQLVVM